ncbi:MAG: hypothetical protein GY870_00575, partial [archaeon]|nr:hypothetical protein [archaeon]
DRYKKFILKIKPDIILGPDPFIHCDGHRDHIATGKNYYYALKSINTKNRPKLMLFFQTIMPDFFIKEQDRDIVKKVRLAHKSQMPPLIFNTFIPNLAKYFLYPTALMRHSSGKNAVGYRRVTFDKKSHVPKGYAKFLFNNFFNDWGFGDGIDSLFIPRPHELGLTLEPKGDIK